MRISVRSRGAVESTFTRCGTPAASRWSLAAVSATTALSGPDTIRVTSRWPPSRRAQKRMSGTSCRIARMAMSTCFWVRWRVFFGVRLMVKVASRTSFFAGNWRPPSTKTLRTSAGRGCAPRGRPSPAWCRRGGPPAAVPPRRWFGRRPPRGESPPEAGPSRGSSRRSTPVRAPGDELVAHRPGDDAGVAPHHRSLAAVVGPWSRRK